MGIAHGEYQPLSTESDVEKATEAKQIDEAAETPSTTSRTTIRNIALGSLLIAVSVTISTIFATYHHPSCNALQHPSNTTTSNLDVRSCGNTTAEALAAGCIIEPLTWAWIAPECVYPEVAAHHLTPFLEMQWYTDETFTQRADEQQIMTGALEHIWTQDRRYHVQHCLFLLRKLGYALEKRVPWLDVKTANGHHSGHCVDYLARNGNGTTPTWLHLTTYDCRRAPWAADG